jgi:hypothetical protein
MHRKTLFAILCVALLLSFGCADRSLGADQANSTAANQTNLSASTNESINASVGSEIANETNQTVAVPTAWPRYNTSSFSFPYPPNMTMSETKNGRNGIISGQTELPERTDIAVKYVDTEATYGKNREGSFQANPTKTASDFLSQDKNSDTMGFFMKADYVGDITTFTLGKEAYCAQLPFHLKLNSGSEYSGYAITIYIPSSSMLVDARIMALNESSAKEMREQFLYGFKVG